MHSPRRLLLLVVAVLVVACGRGGSGVQDASCMEVQTSSAKADAVARAVLEEVEGLRTRSRGAGGAEGGGAGVSQDKTQDALIDAGYRALLTPVKESCKGVGPNFRPYAATVRKIAGELGLPSPNES